MRRDTLPCIFHHGPSCASCDGSGEVRVLPFEPGPLPPRFPLTVRVGRALIAAGIGGLILLLWIAERLSISTPDAEHMLGSPTRATMLFTGLLLTAAASVLGGAFVIEDHYSS